MFKPCPTFWMGGNLLDSLCTASSVSMCICTTPGTIWCKLRTCSALTPPSVHTLSTKRDTILITAAPISPGSCSSNPDSASALSLSGTLYHITATSVLTLWHIGSCSIQPHHYYNYLAKCTVQYTATSSLPFTGTVHHTEQFQINILTLYNTASYNTGTWPVPYSATLHHTVHSTQPHQHSHFQAYHITQHTGTTALPPSVTMHYIIHGYISIIALWHIALYNTATPAWLLSCTLHLREYSYIYLFVMLLLALSSSNAASCLCVRQLLSKGTKRETILLA